MFPEPHHPFISAIVPNAYYTFDELHAHLTTGHNIIGTVYMECGAFYNGTYGDALKPVGEVEFVNGVAAQSASGLYGPARYCAGIVGHADLMLGSAAGEVLDALKAAAPGRFHPPCSRVDTSGRAWPPFHHPDGLYRDATFRAGFAELGKARADLSMPGCWNRNCPT